MAPINLPDGTEVSEVILPNGATASEVVAPDGSRVFSAIPDSVVTQYEYEDDSDTSSAIDSKGSNNATINGATYNNSTVKFGSYSLDHDGTDDYTQSNSSVDLAAAGDDSSMGFGGWIYPRNVTGYEFWLTWEVDSDNGIYILGGGKLTNGNWETFVQVGNTDDRTDSGVTIATDQWVHVWLNMLTDNTMEFYIDGTLEATSNSLDHTNIGAGNFVTGIRLTQTSRTRYGDGIFDKILFSDASLTANEVSDLANQ